MRRTHAVWPGTPLTVRHNLHSAGLALVGLAVALAAAPQTLAETAPVPAITGGWSPIATRQAEAEAKFAVRQLSRNHDRHCPRLRRIESAEQQVVAGLNMRIVLQLRDGSRWRVVVWRKLDGTMVLAAQERL